MQSIPITVFTGFLGAGKTTTILSLLPRLPKDYRVVLLKNEFGDVEVDSQLAIQSSLTAVSEILNGCLCCVLVGQMNTALLEIREKYQPDRIIIECSGTAFPATLAFQIRELERETAAGLKLDAIVTVIDAENFIGYEDTSPTAKMQASYTDIILINKWEYVSERQLDIVLDHLNTLNDLTPKIRCQGRNGVDPNLIFGIWSERFLEEDAFSFKSSTHDEVETITIYRGPLRSSPHDHDHDNNHCKSHSCKEVSEIAMQPQGKEWVEEEILLDALKLIGKEVVWRVKGFVRLPDGVYILNWAFGRYDLKKAEGALRGMGDGITILFTGMGERGETKRALRGMISRLGGTLR